METRAKHRKVEVLDAVPVPRPSRVLLAFCAESRDTTSLRRAAALAKVLGAELHVLCVLPEMTRINSLFPYNTHLSMVQLIARGPTIEFVTRAWLLDVLGSNQCELPLSVRPGQFVREVAAHAAKLRASLVVMPPHGMNLGETVTAIAEAAGIPVLVSREASGEEAILAATNLEDLDYPVLRGAATLARRLDAPLLAVHNLAPNRQLPSAAADDPALPRWEDGGADLCRAQLRHASEWLSPGMDVILRRDISTVDAILHEVQRWHADLVVVGTRPHTWLADLRSAGVARQVVERAERSVLVTPLPGPSNRELLRSALTRASDQSEIEASPRRWW
jgi:nucleotide-binding universal stress UspA family protein